MSRLDREPISTYEPALWRLIGDWDDALDIAAGTAPLPFAAEMVCDIYWVTHEQFRMDVRKLWNSLFDERPRPPLRRTRLRGAR